MKLKLKMSLTELFSRNGQMNTQVLDAKNQRFFVNGAMLYSEMAIGQVLKLHKCNRKFAK